MQLPTVTSYGQYSSDNYGAHTLEVSVGSLTVYFSYRTVVAFHTPETGLVVSANNWGPTTGKHLTWIDGGEKSDRLERARFEKELQDTLARYGLA